MTFILAASGKKQSGKDTLLNGLKPLLETRGVVKIYSFADELKRFLMTGMGLTFEQVYGTDAEKNSLTEYRWETLPKYIRWDFNGRKCANGEMPPLDNASDIESQFWQQFYIGNLPIDLKCGPITARELMQLFGTDMMRRVFSDRIWVNSCLRSIARDKPKIALIPDMRFPSEFKSLHEGGAHVIRLMRDVSKGDQHPSETALDGWDWKQYERVLVIPADATIEGSRQMAIDWLETNL